ncbi:MAG: MBG domain-containing protein, partial [Oscillospiraceae bacterium]
ATYTENPNYNVTVTTAKLTINKKQVSISVENASKTYGEADPTFSGSVSGLVADDELGAITYGRAVGDETKQNAGDDIALTAFYTENPNYTVAVTTAKLTINKKLVAISVENASKTYGEEDPSLTAEASGLVGSDTLAYTLQREAGEDAGAYKITVALGENKNYEVTASEGTFTIYQKTALVTPGSLGKTYGEADPALTAAVDGLVGSDTLAYTLQREAGENVGDYSITAAPGENKNYVIEAIEGTFTIAKRDAVITVQSTWKNIYEYEPALKASVTGTVNNEVLNYTLSRIAGEALGDYAINATLGENPNYNVTVVPGVFSIKEPAQSASSSVSSSPAGSAASSSSAPVSSAASSEAPASSSSPAASSSASTAAISEAANPLASASPSWALLNLLLTIASALTAVALLVSALGSKKKNAEDWDEQESESTKHGFVWKALGILLGLVAAIVMLFTQKISGTMVLVNSWTILFAVLFAAQLISAFLSKRSTSAADDSSTTAS